jgi:hypothetical protein
MPVTNRLLRKLQETLGDEPTQDLVAWVGEAGAVNRQEARELADLYLSRFDERVERRLAEHGARWDRRFAEFEAKVERRFAEAEVKVEQRFAEFEAKMDRRFAEHEARLGRLEGKVEGLEHRMSQVESKLGELENRMITGFATVRIEINDRLSAQYRDLLRWLFIFWAGTIIPLAGLMIALQKL